VLFRSDAVRTISIATQQQQTGTDQLAEAMADILGITQQSLAGTRQLTAANERLQGLSRVLADVLTRFETRE
jgi:methyl-accepting chemotaxis protein